MLLNYLKTTANDVRRHRLISLINVLGLAIGLAACLLMYAYARNELGFDDLHTKADNIYRLNEVQTFTGTAPQHVALSMYPMGPALQEMFPEIVDFVRLIPRESVPFTIDDELRSIRKIYAVDTGFFDIFDFPLLYGNAEEAFTSPNSIVLSASTARAMFGAEEAIGRTLSLPGQTSNSDGGITQLEVTGILQDVTPQSHLQFDALVPIASFGTQFETFQSTNWGSNFLNTYLLLEPGTDIEAMTTRFPEFLTQHMGERGTQFYELYLQPLSTIHLDSMHITHDYQNSNKSSRSYITIFLVLAAFVLAIAAINFMNLTSARLAVRLKEVGIRRSMGATKGQVMLQFLGESVLFAALAGLAALGLVSLALPVLNGIIDRDIGFNPLTQASSALALLGVVALTGICAGLYPAMLASSMSPFNALRQKLAGMGSAFSLQNGLVLIQFSLSVGMIIATLLVLRQLDYIQNRDIGLDNEHVVLLPMDNQIRSSFPAFKEQLLAIDGVQKVTASSQRLGNNLHQGGFGVQDGTGPVEGISPSNVAVELDFLDFYDIELLEGRDFSRDISTDLGSAYIINETMLRFLDWDGIEGKSIGRQGNMGSVIGLVRDFNFNSLHHEVQPLIIHPTANNFSEISVKVDAGSIEQAIAGIEDLWREFGSTTPFRYEFLDQHFDQLYRGDRQAGIIVSGISALTILIACLGLYGLTSLAMERRTKEIAIRKVVGASTGRILLLLNREFSLLILGAIVLVSPVVWYFINDWLNGFAYRIEIGVAVFLAGGLVAAGIGFVTVSSRVLYTAGEHPVGALRDE